MQQLLNNMNHFLIGGIMSRVYKPLDYLSNGDVNKILESDNMNEIIRLPLSVGMNHPNWKYAQNLCVKLSKHEDARVRSNAVLGFAYIARTKGMLEKNIVKPIVLKELNENKEYGWRITDSINDINLFMKWNIGQKALNRGNVSGKIPL
jgi:hypothetical protein